WALGERGWRPLAGLAVSALAGTMAAAVQLLPFLENLGQSVLVADRAAAAFGLAHLTPGSLLTWVAPNARGNPVFDGSGAGFGGNYNETAGFATVTMLALAPIGAAWGWSRRRPAVAALVVLGLVAAGSVYGPLTPLVGRLPLLS